jgi:hypothetical protein
MSIELYPIKPDRQDFRAVQDTPYDPSKTRQESDAYLYQLAQAAKLIRLYEHGQLPLASMGELDAIRAQSRTRHGGD